MNVAIINSLQSAAGAYIAHTADDDIKDQLFIAVREWVAASYEADGYYSEAELEGMDFTSAAHDYIALRISR